MDKEKALIETLPLQDKRVEHLLDKIIIPSLKVGVAVKYKRFLEVMEKHENVVFTSMAKKLGMYIVNSVISHE